MLFKNRLVARTKLKLLFTSILFCTTAHSAVVSSIHPIGMITAAITQNVTTHEVLAPTNSSPHDFALRPSDLKMIKEADLVIWIGDDMEGFLAKPIKSIGADKQLTLSNIPAIEKSIHREEHEDKEHASDESDHEHSHTHDHSIDYHIWMSPEIAAQTADAIANKLSEQFPDKQTIINQNLATFQTQLQAKDAELKTRLSTVSDKKYYVFHDGYGYFEEHYGLANAGHLTVNPTVAPGAKQLAEIKSALKNQTIACVFSEPQYSEAVINAVINGTSVKTAVLDPVGSAVELSPTSYFEFLDNLSQQYLDCLHNIS